MLKVNKKNEPEEFTKYKSKNKIINWDSFNAEIKQVLKQYLLEEQENSHIEHIKPKNTFPNLLANYSNFIACCLTKKRCGDSKASNWNELFINPVTENPEDYFEYDIKTGKIIPIFKDGEKNKKANYTIELLNLNDNRLCDIRKIFIVQYMSNKEVREYLKQFPSLRRYLELLQS